MKEIKFRQPLLNRDGSFHKFHYWGIFKDSFIGRETSGCEKGDDQQYTDLKDKNGVETYFDDLVKWGKAIYKVVWNEDEGIAALQYIKGKEVWKYLRISQIKQAKVIGNIHENPELVK